MYYNDYIRCIISNTQYIIRAIKMNSRLLNMKRETVLQNDVTKTVAAIHDMTK